MFKKLLPSLILLLLLFTTTTPALAASPSANLSLSPDKKYVNLSFSGLKNVSRVAYTLTYFANGRQTGFEGGLRPKPKTSRTTRRQILGTCSTRFCTYHKNPNRFNLTVTFHLRSGGTSSITRTL